MSTNSNLQIKKMKQGMSYSGKEKTIIMNVFKYFRNEFPNQTVTEIVRKTTRATGCSEKSIFSFRKEEISPQGFKEPSKRRIRKNINSNNRLIKYNETVRKRIKEIIYQLKNTNPSPSLTTILKSISADNSLPKFSVMTLRRLLFDMGFYYEKNGTKTILLEKNSDMNCKSINTENIKPIACNSFKEKVLCNNISENKIQKVDNQQSYSELNYQHNQRISVPINFEGNYLTNQKPIMFPSRIPTYGLHPSGNPYYTTNTDMHMKKNDHFISYAPQHILPHNVLH
ncbi:uncharacterized protein LOC115875875 [Sitophilus oryzae]|uniref:Uncharacterized protein LOC115875875 n=1 Tax=Sitophilus oryzae TaxID=7048 RepID=A0A6J2X8I9_SITOR|nr:uncharacterized protein LOC115875875 [Sitophilus oryzae]